MKAPSELCKCGHAKKYHGDALAGWCTMCHKESKKYGSGSYCSEFMPKKKSLKFDKTELNKMKDRWKNRAISLQEAESFINALILDNNRLMHKVLALQRQLNKK